MIAAKRVLFVCTGNTCRSPMAEALFRKAVSGRTDYSVKSAGVAASKGAACSKETADIWLVKKVLKSFRNGEILDSISG